ncbi:MAG: hypothetical protein GTO18_00165 [Anaerolineales bacterium]|nr:hypothetical protein [Anaerolineales bacterium]
MSERPYKPSWVDRLTDFIERLPPPPWLVYLALAVPLVAVFVAVQAWQGAYRAGGFFTGHIFVAVQPLFGVIAVHFLDRIAANAIRQFRPVMRDGEIEFDAALYRLTTLPARQTGIAGMIGALFVLIQLLLYPWNVETLSAYLRVSPTSISLAVYIVYLVVTWFVYGAWIYHALHQLKVIDWLYTSKAVIDPYYPEPLYALSGITFRTVIVALLASYGWYWVVTGGTLRALPSDPGLILVYIFTLGLTLLAIGWPLWGAHKQLVDAKNRALEGNARNYKAVVEELHRMVSARELDEIDMWRSALAALDMERRHLDRLATWPWSPGAFRNLMLALFIPILIWIAQYVLQQLLD